MAVVFDKDGKEYEVIHAVDVAEWIKAGYLEENPKQAKAPKRSTAQKVIDTVLPDKE